jgi:hypothetical protein
MQKTANGMQKRRGVGERRVTDRQDAVACRTWLLEMGDVRAQLSLANQTHRGKAASTSGSVQFLPISIATPRPAYAPSGHSLPRRRDDAKESIVVEPSIICASVCCL